MHGGILTFFSKSMHLDYHLRNQTSIIEKLKMVCIKWERHYGANPVFPRASIIKHTQILAQTHGHESQCYFNGASIEASLFVILWSAEAFHNILHLHDLLMNILVGFRCLQPLPPRHNVSRYAGCCLSIKPLK